MKKTIFVAIIFGIFLLSKPLFLSAQEAAGEGETVKITEERLNMAPCNYLKKHIVAEGVFLDASTSILDDWFHNRKTRFSSKDYVNFRTNLIFQYFMQQDKAGIISQLETGDKIIISGWVTSCDDKRPWIEVDSVVKIPRE
jgi:hypothetical protein